MSFRVSVVVPEVQVYDIEVNQVILPAYDGMLGVLTDRAPMLAKLSTGPVQLDLADGKTVYFLVEGGIAQMKENRLTILTGHAERASEIDAESARAEYAEALARRTTTESEILDRDKQLQRARARITVAEKSRQ